MKTAPSIRKLHEMSRRVRELLANVAAIAAAVVHLPASCTARRSVVALRLLAVAGDDRYEITDFYLATVHFTWRRGDRGPQPRSVAEAMLDDELDERSDAQFTLLTGAGAVLAEWHGAHARALLGLGRLAGSRENSPYGSDDRFAFEWLEEELLSAE